MFAHYLVQIVALTKHVIHFCRVVVKNILHLVAIQQIRHEFATYMRERLLPHTHTLSYIFRAR